jgi:hypothetical protein
MGGWSQAKVSARQHASLVRFVVRGMIGCVFIAGCGGIARIENGPEQLDATMRELLAIGNVAAQAVRQHDLAVLMRLTRADIQEDITRRPGIRREPERELGCVACHGGRGRGDGPSAPGLKDYLDSLVQPERRLVAGPPLGEEPRGWMAVRMGRMMGGMMGRGMMRQMPGTP